MSSEGRPRPPFRASSLSSAADSTTQTLGQLLFCAGYRKAPEIQLFDHPACLRRRPERSVVLSTGFQPLKSARQNLRQHTQEKPVRTSPSAGARRAESRLMPWAFLPVRLGCWGSAFIGPNHRIGAVPEGCCCARAQGIAPLALQGAPASSEEVKDEDDYSDHE